MAEWRGPDAGAAAGHEPRSRWPEVIGIIGIVLSVVMVADKVDDVLTLGWAEEDWRRIFGAYLTDIVTDAMPPAGWRLVSSVAHIGLGVLLFVGSIGLRRHRRSAVAKCRLWALLAIVWVAVEIGWAIWWLSGYTGQVAGVSAAEWQGYAAFGIAVAVVILLAFPLFLLVWLARREVRAEYESWTH